MKNCNHTFFKCQVPAGDSCVPIYHKVCKECRWDETKGQIMPKDIWKNWAEPQVRNTNENITNR